MIKELDPVVLTQSLPEQRLQAGDVGWVVMIHAEVEFVTLAGDTISVVTVPAQAVRPVRAKEIAHARVVA
jgi:translation elongation factor EF-4